MVMALFVAISITAIGALLTGASNLLSSAEDGIGQPRPLKEDVITTPVQPPASWPPTTVAAQLLTWVDKPIETSEGCLALAGFNLVALPCTAAGVLLFSGFSGDGSVLTLTDAAGTVCLTGDAAAVPPTVGLQTCGGAGQDWVELTLAGTSVTYGLDGTSLCLTSVVAPDPILTLSPCTGDPTQTFTVVY